jgi:diguanylate cyclase (GGDEF)-like protein
MSAGREGTGDGVGADAVALTAARALLRIDSRAEAAAVLRAAIRDLGGRVVECGPDDGNPLAPDVSLGLRARSTAVPADRADAAAVRRLAAQLPGLVEDAQAAAARCDRYQRQAARARTDALTGLAGRSEIDSRLTEAIVGDVVCLLDLDGFKALNDAHGHAAGDGALRRFARLLAASVRDTDFVGRYGGDEFLAVMAGAPLAVAEDRMRALVRAWARDDQASGVSIGLAVVDGHGPDAASVAADRALYRAKRAGGSGVAVATAGEYSAAPRRV